MLQVPNELYDHEGELHKHFQVIQQKLDTRKHIYDEDLGFVSNHNIDDKKDILLVSKHLLPELFKMNQKEVMYNNTSFNWRTSVNKFI